MKRFCQILVLSFSLVFLTGNLWANCDLNMFDFGTQELDIPCVDIGIGKCMHVVLSIDITKTTDEKVVFKLEKGTITNEPVPTGEEAALNSNYDEENDFLNVPYIVIDETLDTYNVSFKIDTNETVDAFKWSFILDSIENAEMPNICSNDYMKSCRARDDDGSLIYCVEFIGDADFVNAMSCGNAESAYAPCPAGALSSCTHKLYGNNFSIEYSYQIELICTTY